MFLNEHCLALKFILTVLRELYIHVNWGSDSLYRCLPAWSHIVFQQPHRVGPEKAPVFRRQNYRGSWGTGFNSGRWTEATQDLNPELSDSRAWTEAALIPLNSIVKHFGLVVHPTTPTPTFAASQKAEGGDAAHAREVTGLTSQPSSASAAGTQWAKSFLHL